MKKIEFVTDDEDFYKYVLPPVLASKVIPEWYKKSYKFYHSNTPSFDEDTTPEVSIKSCIPVFDAMSSGYIQTTWTDIYVDNSNEEVKLHWEGKPDIAGVKDSIALQHYTPPKEFCSTAFFWNRGWAIKTPKGYSTLITTPMYHSNLPFFCVPGIVDSDKYNIPGRSPVFFIRKDFSGVIKQGTPMYQMIPIKRESWKSSKNFNNMLLQKFTLQKRFFDRYKKEFWEKKYYS